MSSSPSCCTNCGFEFETPMRSCPRCGNEATIPIYQHTTIHTQPLRRGPMTLPRTSASSDNVFTPTSTLLLQFLPSGTCISLPLDEPLVLGRTGASTAEPIQDLSEFNAHQHGVSRRHCQIRRRGEALLIADLGSLNGTYLNGEHLRPLCDYRLASGDDLILGTLHSHIAFIEME